MNATADDLFTFGSYIFDSLVALILAAYLCWPISAKAASFEPTVITASVVIGDAEATYSASSHQSAEDINDEISGVIRRQVRVDRHIVVIALIAFFIPIAAIAIGFVLRWRDRRG